MPKLHITEPNGKLYIVTDSHLDENIAPASEFVEMLGQLEDPHTVAVSYTHLTLPTKA